MEVLVDDVIGTARMFAQDDMNDNKGAILKPERWLTQANTLYKQLHKRWMRMGLIAPPPLDQEFTGPDVRLGGVYTQPFAQLEISPGIVAIQGVVRATIAGYRGASVDLSQWLVGAPRTVFQFKQTTIRPTFTCAGSASVGTATFTRVGSAFTLAINPGTTTMDDVTTAIAGSSDVELLFITLDGGDIVLDDPIMAFSTPQSIKGGEVLLTEYTRLKSAQSIQTPRARFDWNSTSPALKWSAFSELSTIRVSLTPRENADTYVVRYYELPKPITSRTQYVTVPDCADDYLSMRLAERAMMTEGGSSRKLDKFINDAEAELGFASAALLKPSLLAARDNQEWCPDPNMWRWF